jgi:transposase
MASASAQQLIELLLQQSPEDLDASLRRMIQQFQTQTGEEDLVFVLLELRKRIKELEGQGEEISPSTPSGMIPVYKKPASPSKKKKKPGRKKGHAGSRRATPERIDRYVEHRLDHCPDCGGGLQRCKSKKSVRTRFVEDIPEQIEPVVTQHSIQRDYCPHCKKLVEPPMEEALPHATIGNRLLALTAFWHYSVGMTLSQIVETLNFHLQFPLSKGGLIQQWHRLRSILFHWYETLAADMQQSAVLHADETGWRVNGKTHWLWCFTSDQTTFYVVDKSRGSPILKELFQEEFDGVLVTDFWPAYDAIAWREHQCCLYHLLNELQKVDTRNASEEWLAFSKKTKRLIKDSLRLRAQGDFSPEKYRSRIDRLYERLLELALAAYTDADTRRLAKRLEKYRDEMFVFLKDPAVPSDNNHAEREIRFAVILRKIMYGNRSKDGAWTQSVLMTILRTLKRRGHNPIEVFVSALQEYIRTGQLPPFPPATPSNG